MNINDYYDPATGGGFAGLPPDVASGLEHDFFTLNAPDAHLNDDPTSRVAQPDDARQPGPAAPPSYPAGTVPIVDPSPTGSVPKPGGQKDWGNPAFNQVADAYRRYYGREPTYGEVSQWGTNIDANYLRAIETQIARTAPPKPPAGPAPTTTPTSARWDDGWFRTNIGVPNNMQDLLGMQGKIEAAGGKLNKNASGQWNGKITTPDGRIVDIMIAAGEGGKGYQWDEGGGTGANTPGMGGVDPLAPWDKKFTYKDFVAPDPNKVQDDPAFKFNLGEGIKAIQRSAAAKGTLLQGGTMKDLEKYGSDLASTDYDKIYGRDFNEWATGRNAAVDDFTREYQTFMNNQDRPFSKLTGLASLGSGAASGLNGTGLGYTNTIGNTTTNAANTAANGITDRGNADAAARVAASNYGLQGLGDAAGIAAILAQRKSGYPGDPTEGR